ncbi:hypothetical protein HMPREF9332_01517 [Alloprevotella rava F0323]|uniref:NfeD-like C-terminal domain-containing protein n=1 Tax=Alloprevotella rava F0323 TaxID=679199 RepID=G5GD88_9BACT|nr:NfeD family protein [Alloprevotella rava]EHG22002.1 hypothetical protein HMPREF9332_01517 [Alloprevotella rava F0323]
MSPLLIIGTIVLVAFFFFAIEVFVTPGFGVPGITATVLILIADAVTFYHYGAFIATCALFASVALVLLLFWLVSRSRMLKRAELHTNIDSTNATAAQLAVKPGDEGHALTRLALIGNAEIDGKNVEVKSAGGFIDEGTPIRVISVQDALILVRPK